jgi:hypothetical protein
LGSKLVFAESFNSDFLSTELNVQFISFRAFHDIFIAVIIIHEHIGISFATLQNIFSSVCNNIFVGFTIEIITCPVLLVIFIRILSFHASVTPRFTIWSFTFWSSVSVALVDLFVVRIASFISGNEAEQAENGR